MDEYIYLMGQGRLEGRIWRIGPKPSLDEWRYDWESKTWRLLAKDSPDDPYWGAINRRTFEQNPDVVPIDGPGIADLGTEEGPPWPHPK